MARDGLGSCGASHEIEKGGTWLIIKFLEAASFARSLCMSIGDDFGKTVVARTTYLSFHIGEALRGYKDYCPRVGRGMRGENK
jgi:hypothetical protein